MECALLQIENRNAQQNITSNAFTSRAMRLRSIVGTPLTLTV